MKKMIFSVLTGIVVITSVSFGVYQYKEKLNYRNYLSNDYQRSFYEAVGYMDNVDKMLDKVRLARKPEQSSTMFAEVWKQAAAAHDNLSELPYNHKVVSNTLKFLSQVSDFSYSMLKKTTEGTELEKDDWDKIDQMREYSGILSEDLNNTISQVNLSGTIDWEKIEKEKYSGESGEDMANETILGSMASVSKQFQQYPSLIYDGPFSEHIKAIEPKMTKGKEKISSEDGADVIKKFLRNEEITDVNIIGKTDTTIEHTIPVYSYEIFLKDYKDPSIYAEVTQQGGYVLWMLNYTEIPYSENYITIEQALDYSEKFLTQNGYTDMKYSYYEINEDSVVINYAPYVNDTIIYPDLIKVKVSLSDGTIVGYEAGGFIAMHHERNIYEPELSENKAKEYVSNDLKIESINKAIIPLESKREVLCYEFKGKFDGGEYIVYINADTGEQEKILELLISENGVLTE